MKSNNKEADTKKREFHYLHPYHLYFHRLRKRKRHCGFTLDLVGSSNNDDRGKGGALFRVSSINLAQVAIENGESDTRLKNIIPPGGL